MEIKIESQKLRVVLEKITLKGKIPSCVLCFVKSGLNITVMDSSNTVLNTGLLETKAFAKYEEVKEGIGITNTERLGGILKSFSGIVTLDIKDNLLTLYNENKSASLVIADKEVIANHLDSDKIPAPLSKFDSGINMSKEIFINGIANTNILKGESLEFKVKDNVLSLKAGNKGFDKIIEKQQVEYKDVVSAFNSNLIKPVIEALDDNINVSLPEDNFAVRFTLKGEDYIIKLVVASFGEAEEYSGPKKVEAPKDNDLEIKSIEDLVNIEDKDLPTNVEISDDLL